jgi:hypothetical protein
MQKLRNAHLIARFVLVWFALSIGAAIASPLVKPQVMDLVCTGGGGMKLLFKTDDAGKTVALHTMDCPLCVTASAPPAVVLLSTPPPFPLAHVLQSIAAAPVAAFVAAPPPARGPPDFI